MTTVLHDGLKIPKVYKFFTSAMLVNGREVHWSLGALLYKTRYYPLRYVTVELQYDEKRYRLAKSEKEQVEHLSNFDEPERQKKMKEGPKLRVVAQTLQQKTRFREKKEASTHRRVAPLPSTETLLAFPFSYSFS